MATSVPLPIAIPTRAWARACASLIPFPAIETTERLTAQGYFWVQKLFEQRLEVPLVPAFCFDQVAGFVDLGAC
jgi:hypothetical protein